MLVTGRPPLTIEQPTVAPDGSCTGFWVIEAVTCGGTFCFVTVICVVAEPVSWLRAANVGFPDEVTSAANITTKADRFAIRLKYIGINLKVMILSIIFCM
jgi:hypothetical protein